MLMEPSRTRSTTSRTLRKQSFSPRGESKISSMVTVAHIGASRSTRERHCLAHRSYPNTPLAAAELWLPLLSKCADPLAHVVGATDDFLVASLEIEKAVEA
jgi:hypothetical protein